MPYGYTNDQWNSMSQADRTAASQKAAGGAGSNDASIGAANTALKQQGLPGQYSNTGYQVLGGSKAGVGSSPSPAASALSSILGGGGGPPATASQMVQQSGVPSAGGIGLPVGGGTVGAGSGAVPAAAGNYSATAQQNPYIAQLMQLSQQQFNKPLDREAELSKLRREQSVRMNEARQGGAQAGRGGLWGSQLQGMAQQNEQEVAGTIKGFNDRETQARNALLSTMTGIAGAGTSDIASQLQAQLAAQQLNENARQANLDYNAKIALLPYQAQAMQLQAAADLMRLL